MKTTVIENNEYLIGETLSGKSFYINFDDNDVTDDAYVITLRFKKVEHLVWSWVNPDRTFNSKQEIIDYLELNTTNHNTMYKVSVRSLTTQG